MNLYGWDSFHTCLRRAVGFQVSGEKYMIDNEVYVCDPRHWADRGCADMPRYSVMEHCTTLKIGTCHDAKFIITGCTAVCHDNLR